MFAAGTVVDAVLLTAEERANWMDGRGGLWRAVAQEEGVRRGSWWLCCLLTPDFPVPACLQPHFPCLGQKAGPLKDQRLQIVRHDLENILNLL